MVKRADFVIVGAGIAGASVASELASHGTVVVLERESFPGYHSTGRSAAVFTEIYGNAVIRALTSASASFFKTPPPGFTDAPLLHARPLIMIGRDDQVGAVRDLAAIASRLVPDLSILDREAILKKAPFLKASYLATGLLEPNSSDLDVNQIHVGFIRKAKKLGAEFLTSRDVLGITRHDGLWTVKASHDDFAAPVLINAAGAWADAVATLAGVRPIGLVPKRRSAFTFSIEPPRTTAEWPTIIDISEQFYFKPDAGKILGSPADETPSAPCDAQPEEIDIAIAIDRITQAADFDVRSVDSRWAGLRSFVEDKSPVVGFDPESEGFFWLAAQGGYGIQTSPALARAAAALARGNAIPADVAALGVKADDLAPGRLKPESRHAFRIST